MTKTCFAAATGVAGAEAVGALVAGTDDVAGAAAVADSDDVLIGAGARSETAGAAACSVDIGRAVQRRLMRRRRPFCAGGCVCGSASALGSM